MEKLNTLGNNPLNKHETKEKRKHFAEGLYVSWEVIPICDLACSHCYSLYEEREHDFINIEGVSHKKVHSWDKLSIDDIEKGLQNLEDVGAKFINIEGGEPTLRPDIVEILSLAKNHGFNVIMSSHGMHLLSKKNKKSISLAELLKGKLDTLSLSLDADTQKINDGIRKRANEEIPSNHFDKSVDFLKWYGKEWTRQTLDEPLYSLKINVLVTNFNKNYVLGVGDIVKKYIPKQANVQLKIVQFHPRGKGRINKNNLLISNNDFEDVVDKIKKAHGSDLSVETRRYSNDIYPFLAIGFNGDTVIPKGEKQEVVDIEGKKLNVLEKNFYDILKMKVDECPEFLKNNIEINSYKTKAPS